MKILLAKFSEDNTSCLNGSLIRGCRKTLPLSYQTCMSTHYYKYMQENIKC